MADRFFRAEVVEVIANVDDMGEVNTCIFTVLYQSLTLVGVVLDNRRL